MGHPVLDLPVIQSNFRHRHDRGILKINQIMYRTIYKQNVTNDIVTDDITISCHSSSNSSSPSSSCSAKRLVSLLWHTSGSPRHLYIKLQETIANKRVHLFVAHCELDKQPHLTMLNTSSGAGAMLSGTAF